MRKAVCHIILVASICIAAACSANTAAHIATETRVDATPEPGYQSPPIPAAVIDTARTATGFRVMTYNIAHGRGQSFHQVLLTRQTIRSNLARIGQLIADQRPQVIAFQELDGPSVWSGNFDHASTLAGFVGYPVFFRGHHGKGMGRVELDYGTGIITQFHIADRRSQVFDTSWRDNKGYVKTVLKTGIGGAEEVDVVSVHLDFLSPKTRKRQLDILARALEQRTRPLVVMGDFNCAWDSDDCVRSFAQRLGLQTHGGEIGTPTFPSDRPTKQLDWILISSDLAFNNYETLPQGYSDHLAVVADVVVVE